MLSKISSSLRARLELFSPKWLALIVTSSCFSLIFFNLSAMPVAMPWIANKLQIPAPRMEWIINSYFLVFAILILPAGRLTDIFGIRRLMSLGFVTFAFGCLWAGLSGNFTHFLIGRSIQGAGAALMFPAMSAHLINSFPWGERGKAFGLNTGISSFFWILGPLLSGSITQYFGWKYVMFFSIPIAFFGLMMTLLTIPKIERKKEMFFDYLGALLLAVGIGSITVVLMQGSKWGWTSHEVGSILCTGFASIVGFFIVTYMQKDPIIDLTFFRLKTFRIGTFFACLVLMMSMVSVFWALYMQNNLHYSPTTAGSLMLLSHFPIIFSSPLGGYLGDKWGEKLPVVLGFFLSACGLIWLILIAQKASFWNFIPPFLVFGIANPLILPPCYSISMEEIVQNKYATASGVTLGLRQLFLPFGMAIFSALYSFMNGIEHDALHAFRSINLMGFIFASVGTCTALFFFPKKKSNLIHEKMP